MSKIKPVEGYIYFTETQLVKLEHAIGFDFQLVKNNKFISTRNYFSCERVDEDWEYLSAVGYAKRINRGKRFPIYTVTRKGKNFIQRVTNVKIIDA